LYVDIAFGVDDWNGVAIPDGDKVCSLAVLIPACDRDRDGHLAIA